MVMDTAPETKLRAIEQLGATIVKATYDECWRTVEQHGSDRMQGRFVHPFDDDDFISGNGTIGLEIVEDLPDVDAVDCTGRRRRAAGRHRRARSARCAPRRGSMRRSRRRRRRSRESLRAGEPSRFERWEASFVDGAGGQARCCRRCGRC